MINAVAMVSDDGLTLQPILDCIFFKEIKNFKLSAVISSDSEAYALTRAKGADIPTYVVEEALFPNNASLSLALRQKLEDLDADLVILAGFMPRLSQSLAQAFSGKIVGIRTALHPAFDGMTDIEACEAAIERGVKISGATSYIANDEGGVGVILDQKAVEMKEGERAEPLRRRIVEEAGWELLVKAVKRFCEGTRGQA